ncbi:hypothetical protein OTB19_39135 [Streptomyces sp. H27-H5]|nr:hypothetical protein [Streptomyces sp. H27-H5]
MVCFDSALGDVADQQVRAAGVAEFLDLVQEVGDGRRGVLLAALSQVVAVGVDEGGPVLRGSDQVLGLAVAGESL